MRTIFFFDLVSYLKNRRSIALNLLLLVSGIFAGLKFNMSIGEGIWLNSPYTIGYILGMMSLAIIFIASVAGLELLFKERDSRFGEILFTTPLRKGQYIRGRLLTIFSVTLFGYLLMVVGFAIGQSLRNDTGMGPGFNLSHYLYPFLVFGIFNTLLICSVQSLMAWRTNNKLMVAVSGLFLYIVYMILLVFSSSPLMAQSLPQSIFAQKLSALADPFGLSAYFWTSNNFTVVQRNELMVPFSGYFLMNRFIVAVISVCLFIFGYRSFSFIKKERSKKKGISTVEYSSFVSKTGFFSVKPEFGIYARCKAILSFMRIDLTGTFKTVALASSLILLLFFLGMELYAEIEKGIRLPQKYASSGLMASTIVENFHLLGILMVVYFVNEIYWKAHTAGFSGLEKTTRFGVEKIFGHGLGMMLLIMVFALFLIVEGIIFQLVYNYTRFELGAYLGVIVFNVIPLILLSWILLLLNHFVNHKYLALAISMIVVFLLAGPFSSSLIKNPLFRFFSGFKGSYSDFLGYGIYMKAFLQRLVFGGALILILYMAINMLTTRKISAIKMGIVLLALIAGYFSAATFLEGYQKKDEDLENVIAATYEKKYRHYQQLPQPTVKKLKTSLHLFPSKLSYRIVGEYKLRNQTDNIIDKILIHFDEQQVVRKAIFHAGGARYRIDQAVSEIHLTRGLKPGDSATLEFEMHYSWKPVNGHQSFNAILENGSFMRISRYYPQIGYQEDRELNDPEIRSRYHLDSASQPARLEDPRNNGDDFLELDMTISTEKDQIAIGTGELISTWKSSERNFFRYKPSHPIPFRFAVSSGRYAFRKIQHQGIEISVFYHPLHGENVDHLLQNAKHTLDYCNKYFGTYPFKSVQFAEVSSFTKGFAATAYPASIFMTEDMVFHANIAADQQQDVVNELAGHELAHLWWGGNQVVPDHREGATLLTETLAMYTEMMLYKQMYGREKMMTRLKMHAQIYESSKGFSKPQSLQRMSADQRHISYSKGAMVMVKISEMIGEDNLNLALRNFLQNAKPPHPKPISSDLVKEILKIAPLEMQSEIRQMFEMKY